MPVPQEHLSEAQPQIPSPAPGPRGSSRGRATLITASSQLASPLAAALLGIYIAREFRTGPTTDAFFFANAVYGVVLFIGTSLRTTAITGLMVEGRLDRERLAAHIRAVGMMILVAIAIFAILAVAVVPAFLPNGARGTAQACLLILLPAAALQLVAGLLAAALATNDDFVTPAAAYICAAFGTVVAAVALRGSLGVEAVPAAMALGAAAASALMGSALWRTRETAAKSAEPPPGTSPRVLFVRLTMGAAATIAPQIIVSVTVVFAAHVGRGDSTVMAYGQTAIVILTTLLATPVMTVYAPVVAREHRHDVHALLDLSDRAFRAGAVATPVAIAALCLLAPAPADALLSGMTQHQVSELFRVALLMSPCLLLSQALVIPMLGVVTSERFLARASATLTVAVLHVVLCALVIEIASNALTGLALTMVVSTLGLTFVDFKLAFAGLPARALAGSVATALRIAIAGGVAFGLSTLLLRPSGHFAMGLLTFAVGGAAYSAWLVRRHRAVLEDLFRSFDLRRA